MLANPDFNGEFDYASYVEIGKNGQWRWGDFFSANFAWHHSVRKTFLVYLHRR